MEEFGFDKAIADKLSEVILHELQTVPARLKNSQGLMDYRFEYLIDPSELPEAGLTPKEIIHEDNKMKLYHYKSQNPKKYKTPLLFVYALINKSYILDLQPGNSFIEYCLDMGHDVYMIDWGIPSDEDRYMDFDTYIAGYINDSVDIILDKTDQEKLNLFGWCIGGSLALIYAALYSEKIKNLVLLTTPFDSDKGGLINLWANEEIFHLEKIIEIYGNMPAKLIRYGVITMYPMKELKKNAVFYDNIDNAFFRQAFALAEKWMNDNIDIPGEAFKKYIYECFQTNNLRDGKTVIDGKKVDLSKITMPVLNLAAKEDHLVTIESIEILKDYIKSKDYTFELLEGGHVGIAYDPRSRVAWPKILDWMAQRSDKL